MHLYTKSIVLKYNLSNFFSLLVTFYIKSLLKHISKTIIDILSRCG